MMNTSNIKFFLFFLILICSNLSLAEDLGQIISGGTIKDSLAPDRDQEDEVRTSPYTINKHTEDNYTGKISDQSDSNLLSGSPLPQELIVNDSARSDLKGSGYTMPGTLENAPNYMSLDKGEFAKSFRKKATSTFNLAYFVDSYSYQSSNDIINKTISEGYKHVKAGLIQLRSDKYIFKSLLLNGFWSMGGGISYNSGRGTFVDGNKSDVTFTLWEIPMDLGLGIEIPVYKWFTFAGVAGPSGMVLAQNRNDFSNGEDGKNKFQFGYGQFVSAQFKLQLAGFSDDLAYDIFTGSEMTNLSVNLEARFQNYKNFQDTNIAISGTSYGIGFTFEFL